ncbi:MAG: hypothetical protein Q9215_003322 [Flavoplaca cf. flavocitrina]
MAERLLPKQTPKASHGRGGAGNIGPTVNDASKSGLTTPTIKTSIYTTGRGGSGNMKHNDPRHPELARKSQDVVPPLKRKYNEERGHTGRGKRFRYPPIMGFATSTILVRSGGRRASNACGAANIIHPSIDEVTSNADEKAVIEEGMLYDQERKQAGGPLGDWWRDEMAMGGAVRRR